MAEIIEETKNLETEQTKPAPRKRFGKVINGSLNLRSRPSLNSNVIMILDANSKVQILNDKNEDFVKVLVNDTEGYCMKKFIEVK